MLNVHESRAVITADMIFTGLTKMTFMMDQEKLEEIAVFFDAMAQEHLRYDDADAEERAEATVYTAVATFARAMKLELQPKEPRSTVELLADTLLNAAPEELQNGVGEG